MIRYIKCIKKDWVHLNDKDVEAFARRMDEYLILWERETRR